MHYISITTFMGGNMKKNMGITDRLFRVIVAIVIGVLYFTGQLSNTAVIILGIFAVIFLITSFISFCPLYAPFKISTKKEN
jgi:hypothetical protein